MSKVNTAVEDNIFLRYLVIIAGMIIACIGINGFIRPAHLLSGGVPGISTAINYLTGINIGILTLAERRRPDPSGHAWLSGYGGDSAGAGCCGGCPV